MRSLIALLAATAVASCIIPASVDAQTEGSTEGSMSVESDGPSHYNGSIGFHNTAAPLGVRWWFGGQRVAVDVGLGFDSEPAPDYDEQLTGFAFDVGVPLALKSWDKVHLLFRPGLLYESHEVQMSDPPDPFATDDATALTLTAEIEAEIFIVDNFSVSASHGIGFFSEDPAGGGDSDTSFGTLGNNFSHIGFHIYFFGGGTAGM